MGKYNKDDINFHVLLKSVREYKDVSLEDVCRGLCSESMMHYIENGDRLPDYLMRNRIMSRLGVSPAGYEDYVQYDEYDRWLRCQALIDAVEQENLGKAEAALKEIKADSNCDDKIEWQIILDMEGRISEQKDESWSTVKKVYEEAIHNTVPDLDFFSLDSLILSVEEVYLILRLLRVMSKVQGEDISKIVTYYELIADKINRHFLDEYAKAKIYSMAVCGWYEAVKSISDVEDREYRKIWKHSCCAIDSLRNSKRTYYLFDLLKLRKELLAGKYVKANEEDLEDERAWEKAFEEVYSEYGIKVQMNFSGYIYYGAEIYCIGDVVRKRRMLYRMSRKELSDGICDVRTLMRIENKQTRPQQYVVERLFERLGINSDYRVGKIKTNDYRLISKYNLCQSALNDGDWDSFDKLYDELTELLDLTYIKNKQVMKHLALIKEHKTKEITLDILIREIKETIQLSAPIGSDIPLDSFYTDTELGLLYKLGFSCEDDMVRKWLVSKCENSMKPNIKNHISIYELIMGAEASRLGNLGNYDDADMLSDFIIRANISLHRTHGLIREYYNITWNKGKQAKNLYSDEFKERLNYCRSVAYYSKEYNTSRFFETKIERINCCVDWT